MSLNKKIIVAAFAGLALGVSSCKKYLDVNTDPNAATTARVENLLPAAQLYLGSAVGTDLEINGSIWAQFWTQSPDGSEYVPFEQFKPGPEAFSTPWANLYAGAENFYQLYNLAETQHNDQYQAIALLMQAYTYQAVTDAWGDVPFTDALKGQYPDGHIVNPPYDSQRVVYRGILAYLDVADSLLGLSGSVRPGADDLVYGGDMSKWQKFSNTLRLRILLRMSDVDPIYAERHIDTLFRNNPVFIGSGDEAAIKYGSNSGNSNPLYAELSSTAIGSVQQLAGSKTCIDEMAANNDYRSSVFYKSVGAAGIVGVKQGEYDIALPSGSFSTPSTYVGANIADMASANASVMLMSSWESKFLQAEAVARGYTAGDDGQLFYQGIRASFDYYGNAIFAQMGVTPATAYDIYVNGDATAGIAPGYWTAYPFAGSMVEKLRFIITQKWFAMCGNQGFEAWTEWRRTGFPDFLIVPRSSYLGNDYPSRFIYPASEAATNSLFPGQKVIVENVWWDVL